MTSSRETSPFLLVLHSALDAVNAPQMVDHPEPHRAIHRITQLSFDLHQKIEQAGIDQPLTAAPVLW